MKKVILILIAFAMLLGSFAATQIFAGNNPHELMLEAEIYADPGGPRQYLLIGGTPVLLTPTYYDGKSTAGAASVYPAYCVHPDKPSPNEVGSYYVSTKDYVTNPKIWGIVSNGYPYKSIEELGVETKEQAIYATGVALWSYLKGWYISNFTAADPSQECTLAAMKAIYTAGTAVESIKLPMLSAAPLTSTTQIDALDPGFASQTFSVTANMDISSYMVTITGNAPVGAYVTDMSNNPKTAFAAEEQFKILIPAASISKAAGAFEIEAEGLLRSNAVIYGLSYDQSVQDFALTRDPFNFENATTTVSYVPTDDDVEIEESETNPGSTLLEIIKLSAGTRLPLSGAVFRVTSATNGVVGTFVTDSGGRAVVPLNRSGAYYIEELTSPKGYVLSETPHQDVVVIWQQTTTVTFVNEKCPVLNISKIDADTGVKLRGAVLRVAREGGAFFIDVTTDVAGSAALTDLAPGTYTVTELVAPEGYILDTTPQTIILESGKTSSIMLTNQSKPGLVIRKYDEDSGILLSKAEFSVAVKGGSIVYEGMTDANGTIRLEDLAEGWYTVTELAAPKGYLVATESKDVYLEPGKTVEVKFDNRLRPALRITKIDSQTNQPLAGAVFHVRQTENLTVSEYVTDITGTVLINDLEEAIYTVYEVKAPDGYLLDEQHKDIQLEWGRIKNLVFTNKARPALEILKVDEETGKPLAGAKFHVGKTEDSTVSEYITDATGRILITDLDDVIYSVEEIAAPAGYLLEAQHKDIKPEWGQTKQLVFTNKARPKLRILKVDVITGKPLANAEFRVTKLEDATVSEYITDASGEILIDNLDECIYLVEEFMAPEGYLLYTESKLIDLEWGKTKTLKFDNIRKPNLIITKINGLTFQPIPNTTFKIEYEGANGGSVSLGTYRTDENGQIILPKVDSGWYILTETIPAPGFSLPSNPVTRKYLAPGENAYTNFGSGLVGETGDTSGLNVQVTYGGEYLLNGQEIIDYPLNSIVIRKVSSVTGELLAGAVFELRKVSEDVSGNSGTVIGRYTTDNSGVIVITGLQPGGYVIEETKSPVNYLLSENAQQQAWLKWDGTSIAEVTFANVPYGSLLVTKADAQTGKPLGGARFHVTDGSGAAAGNRTEWVTDATGQFVVPNLKPGDYVISEIEAPQNYAIDTTPQTVRIGSDGATYKVDFYNQPTGGIIIRKLDFAGNAPLAGAQFKVTASNGAVIGTTNGLFTTDATGTIHIPHLTKGTYIVEEIKAPDNYILENQAQTIAVDYGQTYTLTFYNKLKSGLQILKQDSLSKLPLKHAEFTVYTAQGNLIGVFTTDTDGLIFVDNLNPGWYKAAETKAPAGYIADDTPQDFQITDNQLVSLLFEDNPLSGLLVHKVEAATLKPLPGAEFSVKKMDGTLVGNYRTDAYGSFFIEGLASGWYIVNETKVPAGYILDDTAQVIEVTHSKLIVLEFQNKPLASIQIKKIDEISGNPLPGAKFTVRHQGGAIVGDDYTTGADGTVSIPAVEPGWYVISETCAPQGYVLNETAKIVEVKAGVPTVVTITNRPLKGIEILKLDAVTHKPLANATFRVEKSNGELIGVYKTDSVGVVLVTDLQEGTYILSETIAPDGYVREILPQTIVVKANRLSYVEFVNEPYGALMIAKVDDTTGAPLSDVAFNITTAEGALVGNFVTDHNGSILLPSLAPGNYVVRETRAKDGYLLDNTAQTVIVKSGETLQLTVRNRMMSGLQILKIDANTKKPLKDAKFTVYHMSGEIVGVYTTDSNGVIILDRLSSGWYKVAETKAPDGYLIDDTPQDVRITSDQFVKLVFENKPQAGLLVRKVETVTLKPLAGAEFTVKRQDGRIVGNYRTGADGTFSIATLEPGWYVATESKAPDGYILDNNSQAFEITHSGMVILEFQNKPLSGIEIVKLDAVTRAPLSGATFIVEKPNGERIGQYRTDWMGKVVISSLDDGNYIISEVTAPYGYLLDEAPRTVTIRSGVLTVVEFLNKPMAGLQINKLVSVTRQPIEGAEFSIRKMNGEYLGSFKTNRYGTINLSMLEPGWYTVNEIKAASGYILDASPHNIEVTWGKTVILDIENTPVSSLVILKTDATTGKPLAEAKFEVKRANGEQVGIYVTDLSGRIYINDIPAGRYIAMETAAPSGYELDSSAHEVTIYKGRQATLEIKNKPQAGLRLLKIDSVTKQPIYGVEFMVFDANNKVMGTFYTDNNGVIDFSAKLSAGRYTIRETRAAAGYYLDETPKTVEFAAGKVTEIRWENVPQMGQIQILKKSGEANEINGLPAGTPLAGAVFELLDAKTGNLVDRIISGNDGRAVSKALPLGRYVVREVQVPQYYRLSTQELNLEIEFSSQIVKQEFLNYPANTGVFIRKTGNIEAMSGDTIKYDIKAVQNTSTVSLSDFYWRDTLPVDAVRLNKIVTGSYNQSVKCKIIATTNKGDSLIIADNLSSSKNNVVDCSNSALGLRSDEYITSFTLVFGMVKSGFAQVEQPQVYVTVNKGLPHGYQFTNKADVGGKYGDEWIVSNGVWTTSVYSILSPLPKTGY